MEMQRTLAKSSSELRHDLRVPANQDVDVDRLTEVCLRIAALVPGQFDAIADIINDYRRLFESVPGIREDQTCPDSDTDLPLVSIGPSGIGGRFQREINL